MDAIIERSTTIAKVSGANSKTISRVRRKMYFDVPTNDDGTEHIDGAEVFLVLPAAGGSAGDPPAADETEQVPMPEIGEIVHYVEGDYEDAHTQAAKRGYVGSRPGGQHHPGSNGTRVHPAMVTRVWSASCLNLHVFFDSFPSEVRTSVTRIDTPKGTQNPNSGWRWPD